MPKRFFIICILNYICRYSPSVGRNKNSNYERRLFSLAVRSAERQPFSSLALTDLNWTGIHLPSWLAHRCRCYCCCYCCCCSCFYYCYCCCCFGFWVDWKLAFRIDELSENQPEMPMFTFRQHQIALSFRCFFASFAIVVLFSAETRRQPNCKPVLQAGIFCLHDKNQSHWQPYGERIYRPPWPCHSRWLLFCLNVACCCCCCCFCFRFNVQTCH